MLYKVTANLNFSTQDEANDFYHDCDLALAKAITINPGQPDSEPSVITQEECFHDQSPSTPCVITRQDQTPP